LIASPNNGAFATTIVIAVLALIAEWLLTMIEDRLLTWRPETTINE
jgi:NitT/TauT family transport system permease protein